MELEQRPPVRGRQTRNLVDFTRIWPFSCSSEQLRFDAVTTTVPGRGGMVPERGDAPVDSQTTMHQLHKIDSTGRS